MTSSLPFLLLLGIGLASGQPPLPAVTPLPASVPSASPHGAEPRLELAGRLGFTALYYLLNRDAWSALPRSGINLRSGASAVHLADPLQAIVIFNAWHLPAATRSNDIRLSDLQKNVLRPTLTFSPVWPEYVVPGYIVLIQKRDHEWTLVAQLGQHYLVEDRSGIGVYTTPPQ